MDMTESEKQSKAKRFAEIFCYEQCGNVTKSYLQLMIERKETTIETANIKNVRCQAYRYFKHDYVREAVEEERKTARELYQVNKEEIISNLKEIAFDEDSGNRDRLAALKQLTDIGGFATQNINMNAKADIEVVIE